MKKIVCLILMFAFVITLCACSGADTSVIEPSKTVNKPENYASVL